MNKEEVRNRVFYESDLIEMDQFEWDEENRIFSSTLDNLTINFRGIDDCTFNINDDSFLYADDNCTIKAGSLCTFDTKSSCMFYTESNCIFKTASECTFDTGSCCTFDTGSYCIFKTTSECTFDTGSECTFDTESGCTFGTKSECIFKTTSGCTFDTGSECTFDTESYCIFKTTSGCTFDTGHGCTFDTEFGCTFGAGSGCTFGTGSECVFNTGSCCIFKTVRNCVFKTGANCTISVYINGYFVNNGEDNVIIIRDYSKRPLTFNLDDYKKNKFIMLSINGNIEKDIKLVEYLDDTIYVIDHTKKIGAYKLSFATRIEDYFEDNKRSCFVASRTIKEKTYNAHGETAKKAIEDLNFKIARENTDKFDLARTIKDKGNKINWYDYRLITGACEFGTKAWLTANNLDTDYIIDIHEFYNKYKYQNVYGFGIFENFYEEYFMEK